MNPVASSAQKLDAVIEGAQAIMESKDFPSAARIIFDQCCRITGAVSGYVALLSDDGAENNVLFLESGGLSCTVDPSLPMPIRGLRATVYESGRAAYDNDFMRSEWVEFMPAGHVDLDNVMFAPLNIDGRTVGLMGLANKAGGFTDDDADIAMVFGGLAAIALSNSRHLELLHEANAKLADLARSDELTGLLNRHGWRDVVADQERREQRSDSSETYVAVLDIDGLKTANDQHGHEVGDRLIVATARAISQALRATDHAARLGGDEFGLLFTGGSHDHLMLKLSALQSELLEQDVRVSWGLAKYGRERGFAGAMKDADAAMYRMKHARRTSNDD